MVVLRRFGAPHVWHAGPSEKQTSKSGTAHYDLAYKPKKSKKRQIDRLCEAADERGMPAVYALYKNGPGLDLSLFPWLCCREPPSPSVFGVSMISGNAAPLARGHRRDEPRAGGTILSSWSCSALCPTRLGLRGDDWPFDPPLPDNVGQLAYFAGDMVTALLVRDSELTRTRSETRRVEGIQGFRSWEDAPTYVQTLVVDMTETGGTGRLTDDLLDPEMARGLGGVAIWLARPTNG